MKIYKLKFNIPNNLNTMEVEKLFVDVFSIDFATRIKNGEIIEAVELIDNNLFVTFNIPKIKVKSKKFVTTSRLYLNGEYKPNCVDINDLGFHIWYNLYHRDICALFIDGGLVYDSGIKELEKDSKNKNTVNFVKTLKLNKISKPYI